MTRYSCSFSGVCEVDENGPYASLEECQSNCQAQEQKDATYLIYQYDPLGASALSPSDRIEVVRRLTGVTVPVDLSRDVLLALDQAPDQQDLIVDLISLDRKEYLDPQFFDAILEMVANSSPEETLNFLSQSADKLMDTTDSRFSPWVRASGRTFIHSIDFELDDGDDRPFRTEFYNNIIGMDSQHWSEIFDIEDPPLPRELLREGDIVQIIDPGHSELLTAYFDGEDLVPLDSRPIINHLSSTSYFYDAMVDDELRNVRFDTEGYKVSSIEPVTENVSRVNVCNKERCYKIYTPYPDTLSETLERLLMVNLEVGTDYDQIWWETTPEELVEGRVLIDVDGFKRAKLLGRVIENSEF